VRQIVDRSIRELLRKPEEERITFTEPDVETTTNSDRLMRLFYLMGTKNRDKMSRLATLYNIEKPEDFLRVSRKQITSNRGVGPPFFYILKMGLFKMGIVYDENDDFELLERKIEGFKEPDPATRGQRLRFMILQRDGFKCQYCGRNPRSDKSVILHVDHIMAIANGGSWDESNLITACQQCNLGKLHTIIVDKKLLFPS
jgi:hypothetical protein